jgi:site-specific recombinase XerD
MKHYQITIDLDEQQFQVLESSGKLTICISRGDVASAQGVVTEEEEVQSKQTETGGSFFDFFHQQIERLRKNGCVRTSETYRAALSKLQRFRNGEDISPTRIDATLMENFQAFLRAQNLCLNTISFYMRIMRAMYRRCVNMGMTIDRQPFRNVYTGIARTVKRALLLEDVRRLNTLELERPCERFARDMFMLSFYLRGMSFVDMAYLKKKDLHDGVLTYKRHKTGQKLSIRWEPVMQEIVNRYVSHNKYMLPIIHTADNKERNQYRNIQNRVNKLLKAVATKSNVTQNLSMYWARHSWATIAREHKLPISVISHGLGHANERTTEIYLKSIDISVVDTCNQEIIDSLLE